MQIVCVVCAENSMYVGVKLNKTNNKKMNFKNLKIKLIT